MTERHKVFVSYHHENDQAARNQFERLCVANDIMIPWSVRDGDIDPTLPDDTIRQKIRDEFLREPTVTVVLVGTETWKRKHVDWEIGSTIRDTRLNPRAGLIGILLPSYWEKYGSINKHTIPPRLWDNVEREYATLHRWTTDTSKIQTWIHDAFLRRDKVLPDNSCEGFRKDRTGERWW
ncbi:MAG TPA: TIR domain-containing protein [Magnetospirillum sp.]|nr:TIR domain-containing protein [Magnetospirillum sp.]